MIIKKIADVDKFYDNLSNMGMQGPIDLNLLNPLKYFYMSETGVYYVIKKKRIILYCEDGIPDKNGGISSAKAYIVGKVVHRKGKAYFVGECIPEPWLIFITMPSCIFFPIGFILILCVTYLIFSSNYIELVRFIDKACKT